MTEDHEFKQVETDIAKAERYRNSLRTPLTTVASFINEAQKDGLLINFQIGRDQFGRAYVQDISVVRPL